MTSATYARAGVDLEGADSVVQRIRGLVSTTNRPGVLGDLGGFAGLFSFEDLGYRNPVLASSADGVGTKLLIARAAGRFETVGIDLVAMCVDDLACVGAEPLFLLDYISVGRLNPDMVEALITGIAQGCRQAGCALLGGETAEHPGAMNDGEVDLAGFAVGVLEAGEELGAHRVRHGDALIGLPSPGLRSNGYSLARHVLLDRAHIHLDAPAWKGADHTLADELLLPSLIYVGAVRAALRTGPLGVHACAHITGGGLPGNLSRVLTPEVDALVDSGAWEPPRIFEEIARLGEVDREEMMRVFNMGIGMILVVDPASVDDVISAARSYDHDAQVIGEIADGHGAVKVR